MTGVPLANLAWTYGADPRVATVIRRGLECEDPAIRLIAIQQVCSIGDNGVAFEILRHSPDAAMRAKAAEMLGCYGVGDEATVEALAAALDDSDPEVVRTARTARRRIRVDASPRPKMLPAPAPAHAEVDQRHPWRRFLERWSWQWLQVEAFVLHQPDEVVESGWLGFPGASEETIAALEKRLGGRLPPSYRAFLATTDGFRGGGTSIARIRPAAEVTRFCDEEQEWVEIWTETPSGVSPEEHLSLRNDPVRFCNEYLRSAIQISDISDSAVYLLVPEVVDEAGEWEAWFFANWLPGAQRHQSFWAMLQAEYANFLRVERPPEPPPTP